MHEATFDDDLKKEAVAKRHSTTSEAIGVGAEMGARRVILTHFSQRYREVPSLSALDQRSIQLEDAEDIDDPSADMEPPIEESTLPPATMNESSETLDDRPSQAQLEPQPQDVQEPVQPSSSTTNALSETIDSRNDPTARPLLEDMRIGVAFDGMRVKVGDIMHLDKFAPAFVELYKQPESDILEEESRESVKGTEKRSPEEKAERARKGQAKAEKRRKASEMAKTMKKGEEDEKGIAGEGRMEGAGVTDLVEEKMKAVN